MIQVEASTEDQRVNPLAKTFNYLTSLCLDSNKGKLFAVLVMFAAFFFSYTIGGSGWWFHKKIQHDDSGYFAHVATIVLDGDLDYTNETSMRMYAHKKGVPISPLGPSLMALPFAGAFSLIDRFQGHPVLQDHMKFFGSWTFFGFAFASSFYFFHGVYLFYLVGLKIGRLSKLYVFLCGTGVGLLFYVLFRPIMGHAFEFWTLAMIVYATLKYIEKKEAQKAWLWALVVGLASVLSWFCRVYAFYAFFLPYMVLLVWMATYAKSFSWRGLFQSFPKLILSQALFCLGVVVINYIVYGMAFYAQGSGSDAMNMFTQFGLIPVYTGFFSFVAELAARIAARLSYLPIILGGNSYALLYFSPIIPLGLLALVLVIIKKWKTNALAMGIFAVFCLGYVAGPFLIVLLYQTAGSAYGFRYLWGIVPLGMMGMFMWVRLCWQGRALQKALIILLLCLNIFSTAGVVAFVTMPDICYRTSDINEFGFKEVCSPRENLYRVLHWMGDKRFYRAAWQLSPYKIFYLAAQDKPITHFGSYHPNMPAQAAVLCFSWLAAIVAFVYFKREPDQEPKARQLQK
ncbi:MAG: hypothetical protein KQH53_04510 [Desulfarculaceae bacterium]|nr:hypothetical protein [Desulfarculaceae bacterium]